MAKIAFKVPSGSTIGDACVRDSANLIEAKDVDPSDKTCVFQCSGGANGVACAAEMTYVKQRKGEGYFGNLNKNSKHIAGCPFDKSVATKKIKHPNMTGDGLSDEKLIAILDKNGKKIHDVFTKGILHTGTITEVAENQPKNVTNWIGAPKNLSQLILKNYRKCFQFLGKFLKTQYLQAYILAKDLLTVEL